MKTAKPETDPGENSGDALPAYLARELTRDGDQALIVLDGQVYVLRITRAG